MTVIAAAARTDQRLILRGAAACAIQAPSTYNTQPWRLRLHDGGLDLCVDPARHLSVIDPARRQLTISLGCALWNARLAVRAAGHREAVTLFPDEHDRDVVARVSLGLPRSPTKDDHAQVALVYRRATNRRPFHDRPVSQAIAEELAHTARASRTSMQRLSPDAKRALADLIVEADLRQYADPAFRDELARWMASTGSARADGVPFAEKEYGSNLPFTVGRRLRTPDLGERFAELERDRIDGAPVVAVLATAKDEPIDWLDAGQALQAVLLQATALGLSAAFLGQVLEVPPLRRKVRRLLEGRPVPQTILRLGYADPVERLARRRELDDVLREE